MNSRLPAMVTAITSDLGPLAPLLLLATAGSVWFAAASLKSAAVAIKAAADNGRTNVSLEHVSIDDVQAMAAATKLARLAPSTTVAVSGKYVVVSISKPELFAEWMHAMNEVQTLQKDVQWTAQEICISTCDGGEAAKAYVTANHPRLKVS